MKKVRWKITVILVAAALCGCVNDPTENGVAEDLDTGSRKVLTAPNAVNGELLVKFSDEAIRCRRIRGNPFRGDAYGDSTFRCRAQYVGSDFDETCLPLCGKG